MNKKSASLNRSVTISNKERTDFSIQLIKLNKKTELPEIENKIFHQDLFSALDFLPENFVDLMFIDPPYNLNKKFEEINFKKSSSNEYAHWIESWLSRLLKVLKKDASVYFCSDWYTSSTVYNVLNKYFIVQNRITWEREKGRGAKINWKNCHEDIWFCTKSKKYTFNIDDVKIKRKVLAPYKDSSKKPKDWKTESNGNFRLTFPSNLWNDITIPFWSMRENTKHPTQKPEKLLAKIILASTNPSDLVFDPFAGSGTTLVTSKKLGRRYSGIELNKEYVLYTLKRLKMAENDNSIQGYRDGVFWERNTLAEQKG